MDNSLNLRLDDAAFASEDQTLFPLPEMLCYCSYKIWDDNSGTLIGQKLDQTAPLTQIRSLWKISLTSFHLIVTRMKPSEPEFGG